MEALSSIPSSYSHRVFDFTDSSDGYSVGIELACQEVFRGQLLGAGLDKTGQMIWPAAYLLCDHLVAVRTSLVGQRVIELGAGAGVCGCLASRLGATVTLTDKDHGSLQLLRHNAKSCGGGLRVEELSWDDEQDINRIGRGCMDVVIASELLYPAITTQVVHALFSTVQALLAPTPTAHFLLSFIPRDGKVSIKKMVEASRHATFVFEAIGGPHGGEQAERARRLGAVLLCFRPWDPCPGEGSEPLTAEVRQEQYRIAFQQCVRQCFPGYEKDQEEDDDEPPPVWVAPFTEEEDEDGEEEERP